MASLSLSHIYKVYPNGLKAVNDFSMEIEDREFIVFVGPSGCGKSTTLRMIAGLEEITAGELRIAGEVVNDDEPKDRDIAMVFQNYALYPHMSVFDNMAFGLSLRRVNKDEIKRRVNEAAKILGITDYLQKKPKEMSGGQRQRVALGRAMVREPKVFLLDEPLSNLDAKLRTQMRSEILKLHERIKTTFIYVTHDQVEAMTMGTRIVVMKDGYVQQIDTPRNLYSYPCNKFVAGFIGTPQMNFFDGTLLLDGNRIKVKFKDAPVDFDVPAEAFAKVDRSYLDGARPVTLGIRSEHVSVDPDKYPYKAKCKVSYCEDLGVDSQVYADFNSDGDEMSLDSPTKVIIKAPAATLIDHGSVIDVSLDITNMHIFDAVTEISVMPRLPEKISFNGKVAAGTLEICGAKFALPPAISLSDGDYIVGAAADGVSFGGDIKVKTESSEDIGDITLTRVTAGDEVFFVKTEKGAPRGKTVGIDLKRCDFLVKKSDEELQKEREEFAAETERQAAAVVAEPPKKGIKALFGKKKTKAQDAERVLPQAKRSSSSCYAVAVSAMPMTNVLNCSFKRYKVKEQIEIDGKAATVTVKKHSLVFVNPDPTEAENAAAEENKKAVVPTFETALDDAAAQKVTVGAGRLADKDVMQLMFSPYDVKLSDDGLSGVIKSVADYGKEKFYVCDVNGSIVYVLADGELRSAGDTVKLLPDVRKAEIYDKTIEIRLV